NFKNLLTRAVSGAVLAIVVIGALLYSYNTFALLLLVIAIGGTSEFYNMSKAKGYAPQVVIGLSAALAVVALGYDYFYNGSANNISIMLYLMLIIPLMFIVELFKGGDRPFINLGSTVLALLYIAVPMAMLMGVPLMLSGGVWRPIVMILYILTIWSNDTFAYLVGVPFGKHRLNERISPKKSWEGFFGGVIGGVAMSALAAYLLDASYLMWIGIGVITSVMGVAGDLIESMFKRTCGVKDSGQIFPGHGGWLDRFDGLIFSAPFVFVYLLLLQLLNN
ncbi:MAG: phosphatidate cytidylyltransferase, partial [Rikenellaceae bacterium]